MNFVIAILGLAFIVLIHEAGHFFVSLAVGMRPRKFYIGFPPALVKKKRHGIEYGIGAIPLGGYVRIPGMHRPAAKDVDLVFSRALHAAPELVGPAERLKRSLAAEDFETAKQRLDEFAERAREAGVPPQQTDKHVQDIADALSPQAYWRAPVWKRVAAIGAGPATNLVFAVVLFAVVFMTAGWNPTSNVAVVLKGTKKHPTPAQAAGLRPGDSVIAVNGVGADPSKISNLIASSCGTPVTLTVIRKGEVLNLNPERPRKGSDGRCRMEFELSGQPLTPGSAFWQSIKTTGYVARDTVKALGGIFHKKDRKQFSSVVGLGKQTSEAVSYGWASYLSILAFISLSLGLLNLLPLLPLDGGHIFFSLLEGIRGRAIAREVYERVSAVGIAIVLLLFVIGLSNDVGRFG